jgi:hypothetical protein
MNSTKCKSLTVDSSCSLELKYEVMHHFELMEKSYLVIFFFVDVSFRRFAFTRINAGDNTEGYKAVIFIAFDANILGFIATDDFIFC